MWQFSFYVIFFLMLRAISESRNRVRKKRKRIININESLLDKAKVRQG